MVLPSATFCTTAAASSRSGHRDVFPPATRCFIARRAHFSIHIARRLFASDFAKKTRALLALSATEQKKNRQKACHYSSKIKCDHSDTPSICQVLKQKYLQHVRNLVPIFCRLTPRVVCAWVVPVISQPTAYVYDTICNALFAWCILSYMPSKSVYRHTVF